MSALEQSKVEHHPCHGHFGKYSWVLCGQARPSVPVLAKTRTHITPCSRYVSLGRRPRIAVSKFCGLACVFGTGRSTSKSQQKVRSLQKNNQQT